MKGYGSLASDAIPGEGRQLLTLLLDPVCACFRFCCWPLSSILCLRYQVCEQLKRRGLRQMGIIHLEQVDGILSHVGEPEAHCIHGGAQPERLLSLRGGRSERVPDTFQMDVGVQDIARRLLVGSGCEQADAREW